MSPVEASRQASRRVWAIVAAVAGLLLFQFLGNDSRGYINTSSLFHWWIFQWTNPASETQHAWLVLALAIATAVWNLRRFPLDDEGKSWRLSLAGAAGGLLLHALCYRAMQPRLSVVALLLFLWGVAGLIWGPRIRKALTFPLGYMVFAIPINALDTIGFWLRLLVVRSGSGIAHLMGIAVLRSGTQLLAPDGRYEYDVAAACSGIRSLEAFFALACLLGYREFKQWTPRLILLAGCLPLIVIGNIVRIVAIIVAAHFAGQGVGEKVHDIMGVGIFVVVIGGTIVLAGYLHRWWPQPETDAVAKAPLPLAAPAAASVSILACVAVVAGASLVFAPARGVAGVALSADGASPTPLPPFLGSDWFGKSIPTTAVEKTVLPPDTGFSKEMYFDVSVANPDRRVLVSVVLSGSDRTSIHRPELCLIGQGWSIDSRRRGELPPMGARKHPLPVTILEVHRDVRTPRGPQRMREVVAYCFVGGEDVTSSYQGFVAADAWNRVVRGKADRWAYLLLEAGAEDGSDRALSRISVIAEGIGPSLFRVPQEAL